MKKFVEVKIGLPQLPNYLEAGDENFIHISEFSEEELRALGMEWTAALIEKAKKYRV